LAFTNSRGITGEAGGSSIVLALANSTLGGGVKAWG
jgi:hypothetical protein